MKNNYIVPVLVLSLICFIMTASLSLVNMVTRPIIEEASRERALLVMREIIPGAENFILIESDRFPHAVNEAHRTSNNAGFVFIVTTSGYGGNFKVICGIDNNGRIISSSVLPPHGETPGFGTVVFDRAVEYEGSGSDMEGIDTVTGATISFNAYRRALEDAFTAFYLIKEMGY